MEAVTEKIVTKDPALKLAKKRLTVLQLAETLGNITEACRRGGMDRNSFYEWKRRFQTLGLEGLKDLPPIHKSHPQTTPEGVVNKILSSAMKHPSKGCQYLSHQLSLEGTTLSKVTVQEILNRNGLGSRYDRWLALEKRTAEEKLPLSGEQVQLLERMNPCFRERHVESAAPGQLLCQDTFHIGTIKGVGKIYLQVVIDTFGSYAFAYLHTGKLPEQAAYVLYREVLPFYKRHQIALKAILTDNGKEYCGTENHKYEVFLALHDIEHRRTKVRRPQTNGFVERFHRTALDEFFRVAFRKRRYLQVQELQKDLDEWLRAYNYERPHQGYRNMGRRPAETMGVLKTVRHDG